MLKYSSNGNTVHDSDSEQYHHRMTLAEMYTIAKPYPGVPKCVSLLPTINSCLQNVLTHLFVMSSVCSMSQYKKFWVQGQKTWVLVWAVTDVILHLPFDLAQCQFSHCKLELTIPVLPVPPIYYKDKIICMY